MLRGLNVDIVVSNRRSHAQRQEHAFFKREAVLRRGERYKSLTSVLCRIRDKVVDAPWPGKHIA